MPSGSAFFMRKRQYEIDLAYFYSCGGKVGGILLNNLLDKKWIHYKRSYYISIYITHKLYKFLEKLVFILVSPSKRCYYSNVPSKCFSDY